MFRLSLVFGATAALANVAGSLILVRVSSAERYLRLFVALGAGILMGTTVMEIVPESLHLAPVHGPALIMAGYCLMHLLEHTFAVHFPRGVELPRGAMVSRQTCNFVLAGLGIHALFDGVAIGAGFAISSWLGWLVFVAIFLHKVPEGFTIASVMMASGQTRKKALYAGVVLAWATLAGVVLVELQPRWISVAMPFSCGVAIYVAATDLVPEVNRTPGIRMALLFFTGAACLFLLHRILPAH